MNTQLGFDKAKFSLPKFCFNDDLNTTRNIALALGTSPISLSEAQRPAPTQVSAADIVKRSTELFQDSQESPSRNDTRSDTQHEPVLNGEAHLQDDEPMCVCPQLTHGKMILTHHRAQQ